MKMKGDTCLFKYLNEPRKERYENKKDRKDEFAPVNK